MTDDPDFMKRAMVVGEGFKPGPPDSPVVMREAGTPVGKRRLPAEQHMRQAVLDLWARAEGRSHG